jgi:hypothetical protein
LKKEQLVDMVTSLNSSILQNYKFIEIDKSVPRPMEIEPVRRKQLVERKVQKEKEQI